MTDTVWLSFADNSRFRGVIIVDLDNIKAGADNDDLVMAATVKTIELGINPGGDYSVLGSLIPPGDKIPDQFKNRLLTEEEAEQLRK